MSSIKHYLSILIFTASIVGLFLSMAHNHSEGLECLYHVEDQHYTENELLCPVCGIAAFSEPVSQPSTDGISFQESIAEMTAFILKAQSFKFLPSRAPPIPA